MRRVVLFAALALLAAACSEEEPAAQTTTSPETTMAPADRPVVVTAVDYAYLDLPERVPAGTTFTLNNRSSEELHELVAVRLPDDEARPVEELLQLPPEELEALFPMVETVIIAAPNETGFPVEGTGTLTEPGRYAIICAIPTGADPQAYMDAAARSEGGPPDVPGGPPHFVNGMYGEVVVEG
jgi:hypothetical protein